jgi:glutathione S-transferase
MITLYHCVSARSFRPLWMLEELGLPYDLRMLPFPPRALARPFLQENSLGTVPLLVEGDTRMTESAARYWHMGLTAQFTPSVAAYWARLQQRPAFQRAMAIQHRAAVAQGVPTTPAPDIRP